MSKEKPYIEEIEEIKTVKVSYNPKYGDDRTCICGHTYYRHFDTYENMAPVGCKYCQCGKFVEQIHSTMSAKESNMAYLELTEEQYARWEVLMKMPMKDWPHSMYTWLQLKYGKMAACGDAIACWVADYVKNEDVKMDKPRRFLRPKK